MKDKNLLLQTLFEAVIDTVNLYGFHGSSIAMIARKAGINASNIYHYFSSKDQLLLSTFGYVKDRADEYVFRDEHFSTVQNIETEFTIIFTYYIKFYQNKSIYLSFMEQFGKSPYLKQFIIEQPEEYNGKITQFIEKAIQADTFVTQDIKIIKTMVLGALNELTYHIFSHENNASHQHEIELSVQMLWNALTAPVYVHTNN